MAVSAITSIKNLIGYKDSTKKDSETRIPKDDPLAVVPTVGFRVGYKMGTTKLQVLVLGARHLPSKVGMALISSYTIKVCTSSTELQASVALSPAKETLPPTPWYLLDRRSFGLQSRPGLGIEEKPLPGTEPLSFNPYPGHY